MVFDRGGMTRLGVIDPLSAVSWNRVRDDISFGNIITSQPTMQCLQLLEQIEPNRHELVIFRGQERVWEGPITLVVYRRDAVEIEARDVMHYAHRTVLRAAYNNNYPNIATTTQRAVNVLTGELARKEALDPPINVLPHLIAEHRTWDSRTSRGTAPSQSTVFEDIDSMAAKAGLDYTVVGRAIILFSTKTALGRTAQVTEADFIGDLRVTAYGMEHATKAWVNDGQGNIGYAGVDVDPYYGEWEILDSAYDEEKGTDAPTVAELFSQAERNLSGRNPVPLAVKVPDGSRLNPEGVLQIGDLVPGVHIPLRATLTARVVNQMQKLNIVKVVEDANGEVITVTMTQAAADEEEVPA
jgi:hypothetical protein